MKKSLLILALSTMFLTSCKDNAAEPTTETISETTTETTTETTETKPVAAVGKVETASFTIDGMSCEIMCASKIQKELGSFIEQFDRELKRKGRESEILSDSYLEVLDEFIDDVKVPNDEATSV